jgi:chromosome segregation ATPase
LHLETVWEANTVAAFQNFEEVWAALGRLYNDIVKLQEAQQQVNQQLATLGEQITQLSQHMSRLIESQDQLVQSQNRMVSSVSTLAGTVGQLAGIVDSHERRLERLEGQ